MFLICLSLGMMNQDFGSRLGARSDKESPEVEITNDEEVEITNVVIPVNVNKEEEEITDEVYELKRREKGKIIEESRSTPFLTPIRSPRIHTDLVSSDTEKLQELTVIDTKTTSSSKSLSTKLSKTNRLLSLFKAKPASRFLSRKSFDTLADHLQEVMVESLPTMVDTHIKEQVKKQVPEQMIAKAILQERGNIQAEISSQIQKSIDNHIPSQVDASVRSYMSGNILHVHPAQSQTLSIPEQQYQLYLFMKDDSQLQQQDIAIWLLLQMKFENLQVNENEQGPSTSGNQEQEDDYDFWTESYASDDDEIPTKQMSQDIMEEVSLTIDEAKLKKMVDEMLRQRCTSGDEHQYHIDQMKNFLKSDIVWESRKEILKGSSGPEKIVLSLHKFPAIIFNDDDIEERTSRWVNKLFIRSLVIWERVHDFQHGIESYQQKVNLTTPTISFLGVEKHKMFSIIYEPVHEIIYKNHKKEKRVMRHSEIHKFCDATLNRVLEGLRSYNNDVKYGYIQRDLTNEEVEYLKLFEEEIEVRLKYQNQMRRWEMYVNGRPLGPRREAFRIIDSEGEIVRFIKSVDYVA
ncbi:hypothetical protein Tco_1533083 [Tanacetum coccineum]